MNRYGVFGYHVIETDTPIAGTWGVAPGRRLVIESPPPVERRSTSALVLTALATGPVLFLAGFCARRSLSS